MDSERECVRKSGDTLEGNLPISTQGDNDRTLGCTDLDVDRSFPIPLGTRANKLTFVYRRNAVVMDTDFGFMVKAKNQLVCELGSTYEPTEITIYKDVRMNSKRITNLPEPELAHEVANKRYVDSTAKILLQGYVPSLRTTSTSFQNDKFGFVVTASSHRPLYFPSNAFNGIYARGRSAAREWITDGETRDFWIQIKCPNLVKLWKIGLRGRNSDAERMYIWRLEG